MNKVFKQEKGITITSLVITIIVMMIIASISVYEGKQIIKEAKVQTLETNMLVIKAKGKAYAEEIDAQTWADSNIDKSSLYQNNYGMIATSTIDSAILGQLNSDINKNNYDAYEVTEATLEKMGLNELKEDLEAGKYLVVYDADNYNNMDVVYTAGISYKDSNYYTLSALQEVYGEN